MEVSRRGLFRLVGASALLAAPAACGAVAALVSDQPKRLRPVATGEVLTAEWLNALADRVNELSEGAR